MRNAIHWHAQPYEPAQAQLQAAHGSPSKMGPKDWNESLVSVLSVMTGMR